MKKISAFTTVMLSAILLVIVANAQITMPTVTVRTDRPQYVPGEGGTIHITFHNKEETPLSIHNITVFYHQWQAYINDKWVGNQTLDLDLTVKERGTKSLTSVDFTVPDDGRASKNCEVTVQIGTSMSSTSGSTTINVEETPHYMQQIITLLTILVVLLIVCTIIIAATIFLSLHNAEVTPREPEKQ